GPYYCSINAIVAFGSDIVDALYHSYLYAKDKILYISIEVMPNNYILLAVKLSELATAM
ncbi:37236_t:CDS:1, partial [Gigaspora margarita]